MSYGRIRYDVLLHVTEKPNVLAAEQYPWQPPEIGAGPLERTYHRDPATRWNNIQQPRQQAAGRLSLHIRS
jgi:hypothetical protein